MKTVKYKLNFDIKQIIFIFVVMIVKLQRWICELTDDETDDIMPNGKYITSTIRMDRIDKYSIEDDEIVLTIGGS